MNRCCSLTHHTPALVQAHKEAQLERAMLTAQSLGYSSQHLLPQGICNMYSTSRTWVSPQVQENVRRRRLYNARRRICPHSPFWSENFDLDHHRRTWEAGRRRHYEARQTYQNSISLARQRDHSPDFHPAPIRPAFNNKVFLSSRSITALYGNHYGLALSKSTSASYQPLSTGPVLALPTIFSPQWPTHSRSTYIAPWPSRIEMKLEGPDRVASERIHGRFLATPRIPDPRPDLTWQDWKFLRSWAFDDAYFPIPGEVEIFLRHFWVEELEFGEEEGRMALGGELMGLLGAGDQW